MAIISNTPVSVPVYNSPLIAACDGKLFLAYPGSDIVACGNQASAPLRDNVLVSMCFLNLTIFAVDGLHITTVPLATGNVTAFPLVLASLAQPAAPVLTATGSGSGLPDLTYFVRIAYVDANGNQSLASPETSLLVTAGKFLKVTTPGASTGAVSYSIYVSLSTGTETFQITKTIGTDWTQAAAITSTGVSYPGGLTPTNCFLCCNWRGRFVLAGDSSNPQNFYMSRVGVPTDFNFSALDPAAAVAGNLSKSGQIGEPIVALIPYTDDYMLIGCTNSLWMLQGDPADGGSIVRVSDQMGLVSPNSWCLDPTGTLYFIARGGLYSVRPIWEFYQPPQLLSGETYDQYFQSILNGSYYVSMQWDIDAKYMHIFATPTDDATQAVHLIYDQRNGGLWPQQYPLAQGPTATARYAANNINGGQRAILIGGWDGYIRQWTNQGLNDDGTVISAYAVLGPVKPAPEASILTGVTIDFGETLPADVNNWHADITLQAGPDAYSVTEGTPHMVADIPSTLDRRQKTYRQRLRAGWFSVKVANSTIDTYFSFETALLEFIEAGRNRERR